MQIRDMIMQIKCVECQKWIDMEEYSYGHDCEDDGNNGSNDNKYDFGIFEEDE